MIENNNHWLLSAVQNFPSSVAVEYEDRNYTYTEIYETVTKILRSLQTCGIKSDSTVGLLIKNQFNFFIIVNALWLSGAAVIPLNYRLTPNELNELLKKIKPDILLHDSNVELLEIDIPSIEVESLFLNNAGEESIAHQFNSSRVAVIMLTSGSSGMPKGIVHTFDTIYKSVLSFSEFFDPAEESRWLASLPFYHIGGFMIFCRSLILRHKIKLLQDPSFESVKKILKEESFDFLSLVPTQLKILIDENFRPVAKTIFLGGAPAEFELLSRALDAGWNTVKVYGSTETCSMVTALEIRKHRDKIASSGKPMPGCEIVIMQGDKELPAGESGEIYVNSLSNFIGTKYPEEIYRTGKYFRTGDWGFIDKDGFLYVEARRDDIIITGGENVSSREVLTALLALEYIKDAYVFAESDQKWGKRISAVVVIKKNFEINETKIKDDLRTFLSSFKIPKKFYFLSEIPRNEMGKINLKKLLKLLNQM
ncbi:o-succinylbenzoate--CoA ligase [Melioribacter sp. OK-6-Me]|uniref:o-succinylbenzoate--CoA ligase n=1 Tax=unclassified Melioribacter TaxID=2627329 RepID=UPI003EDB2F6D